MNISRGLLRHVLSPLIVLISLALLGGVVLFSHEAAVVEEPHILATNTITINGQTIDVDVARTEGEREQGLSGRQPLAADQGMLFLFPKPDTYGFWMKDMNFSIDMIWIGVDRHILYIVPNAAPDTYPHVFAPPTPATVVLEVPANTATRLGWKPGDKVMFGDGIF